MKLRIATIVLLMASAQPSFAEAPGGPDIDSVVRIAHCGTVSKSWIVAQGVLPSTMPPTSTQQDYLNKIADKACQHGLTFGAWTEATDFPGPDGDNTGYVGARGLQLTQGAGDCNLYNEFLVDGQTVFSPSNIGNPTLNPVCADLFNVTTDPVTGQLIFSGGVTVPITGVRYACLENRVWGGGNNPETSVSCEPFNGLYPGDHTPEEVIWVGNSDDDTGAGSGSGGGHPPRLPPRR